MVEQAICTKDQWRAQVDYPKSDGWVIVCENADGTLGLEKHSREMWNQKELVMRDRHDRYREEVTVRKDYDYLEDHCIPKALSTSEYHKIFKEGRDPRKKPLQSKDDRELSWSGTRDAPHE